MSLFSELKRRNVFRIGVAYVIVAWLLMQVAALAAPVLFLPEWVTTFVVFVLALGFPIALLLAWAYEVTPEGIKKTKDVPLQKSVRAITGQRINYVVIGLLSIAIVMLLVDRTRVPQESLEGEIGDGNSISIAVLPFENLSGDPDQEHFVDGLTEELLNSLAAIDDFRVISRTSSFAYKGKDVPVGQIASELGVSHLLEGSVRRVGSRIRVTAQLIDTNTDSHLWFENFDRELTVDNILEIQEVVSRTVADRLQVQLTASEYRSSAPSNLEALDHYLDGMNYVRRMQLSDYDGGDRTYFNAAVEAFEASIAEDPGWAPAHAGLGMAYHFNRHFDDEREQLEKSRRHVERAIQLDDQYGRAYNSLGFINTVEGNFDAAFEAYETASLNYDKYHWGFAILLYRLGRYEEAVEEYREAERLDPLSRGIRFQLMNSLYCAGDYREYIDKALEISQLEPDNVGPKTALAEGYVEIGDIENAVRIADEILAIDKSDIGMAYVLAKAGQAARARAAVDSDEAVAWWGTTVPAAAVLGETDRAIDILEMAIARADVGVEGYAGQFGSLRCLPGMNVLTGIPRYDALIERLDLPEYPDAL